jgi:hypothetical protein
MPGLRLTGHEPEFPRRLTLERVAGNTEFWPAALGNFARFWLPFTVTDGGGEGNGKQCRSCAKGVERRKFLWKSKDKQGEYWEDCLPWLGAVTAVEFLSA